MAALICTFLPLRMVLAYSCQQVHALFTSGTNTSWEMSVLLQDEQSTPKQLKGLDDYTFTDVACGSYHTVALADRDGEPEVRCCEGQCSAYATLLIVCCATQDAFYYCIDLSLALPQKPAISCLLCCN
jgi:hypothetical protein